MSTVFDPLKVDYSDANCRGLDTDLFIDFATYREARRVCTTCPCKEDCFFEAARDNLTGTWGGMWHGKPATPGARVSGKGDVQKLRYYRAVLCERLNLTLPQFLARYGNNIEGIRKALRAPKSVGQGETPPLPLQRREGASRGL